MSENVLTFSHFFLTQQMYTKPRATSPHRWLNGKPDGCESVYLQNVGYVGRS